MSKSSSRVPIRLEIREMSWTLTIDLVPLSLGGFSVEESLSHELGNDEHTLGEIDGKHCARELAELLLDAGEGERADTDTHSESDSRGLFLEGISPSWWEGVLQLCVYKASRYSQEPARYFLALSDRELGRLAAAFGRLACHELIELATWATKLVGEDPEDLKRLHRKLRAEFGRLIGREHVTAAVGSLKAQVEAESRRREAARLATEEHAKEKMRVWLGPAELARDPDGLVRRFGRKIPPGLVVHASKFDPPGDLATAAALVIPIVRLIKSRVPVRQWSTNPGWYPDIAHHAPLLRWAVGTRHREILRALDAAGDEEAIRAARWLVKQGNSASARLKSWQEPRHPQGRVVLWPLNFFAGFADTQA